jgi:hydroxyacylglutathione hydrolase
VLGELETNCWLVSDDEGGPLLVIDPAGEPESLIAGIAGRAVCAVVLTHGHFDHLGAAAVLLAETRAPLLVHRADADAITTAEGNGGAAFGFSPVSPKADRLLVDGDTVEAGRAALTVIHTPGHTPGSICLFSDTDAGPHLFSGDTLFAGSIGRTDLAGGDARAIRSSIARVATLPPATLVHPGHGPETTLLRESRANLFWPRGNAV